MSRSDENPLAGCIAVIILVVVISIGSILTGNVTTSSGVRYGTIQKCSRNGIVWSTNELTFKPDNEGGTYVWEASCPNDAIFAKIQEEAAKGRRVKLSYRKTLGELPWRQDTKFIIEGCEELPK